MGKRIRKDRNRVDKRSKRRRNNKIDISKRNDTEQNSV